ncbi:MAG: hypothetical protein OHK0052_00200 [Anaerolineales bacterium]
MPKKTLRNRLKNLFSDIESSLPAANPQTGEPTGWTWECDAQGRYTACSPEVQTILGRAPESFLGELLQVFALSADSQADMAKIFSHDDFPAELNVDFEMADGRWMRTTLQIVRRPPVPGSPEEAARGLRGVALALGVHAPEVMPEHSPVPMPPVQPPVPTPGSDGLEINLREMSLPSAQQRSARNITGFRVVGQTIETADAPLVPQSVQALQTGSLLAMPATLAIPVRVQDQSVGLLELVDDNPQRRWSEDEQLLVGQVVDQLSLALANAQFFQAEQRRANELNTILQLIQVISQTLDPEQVFASTHRALERLLAFDVIMFNLVSADGMKIDTIYFYEQGVRQPVFHLNIDQGLSGYVIQNRKSLLVGDIVNEEWAFKPRHLGGQISRALLAVPLVFRERRIGILTVQSYQPYQYTENDLQLLEGFADFAAIAVENARLFQETQTSARQEQVLRQIVATINASEDLASALPGVMQQINQLVPVAGMSLVKYLQEREAVRVFGLVTGRRDSLLMPAGALMPIDKTAVGYAIQQQRVVIDNDLQQKHPFEDDQLLLQEGWLARLVVPLQVGDRIIGALNIGSAQTGVFTPAIVPVLQQIANQTALALERSSLFEQISETLSETEALYRASRAIGEAATIEDVLRGIAEVSINLGMVSASLTLITETDEQGVPVRGDIYTAAIQNQRLNFSTPILNSPIVNRQMAQEALDDPTFALVYTDVEDPNAPIPPHMRQILHDSDLRGSVTLGLSARRQPIAFLSFGSPIPLGNIPEAYVRRMRTVADQVTTRLENLQLFQRTQRALAETETLYTINAKFNAANTIEEILQALCIPNADGRAPYGATFWTFTSDEDNVPLTMTLSGSWLNPQKTLNIPIGFMLDLREYPASQMMFSNPTEPLLFGDVVKSGISPETKRFLRRNRVSAAVFLPLTVRGRWLGQITILWDELTTFNAADLQRYRALAAQAAITINSRLLFEQTERRARQLEWVSMIKNGLSQSTNEADILSAISLAVDMVNPPERIVLYYLAQDPISNQFSATISAVWSDGIVQERAANLGLNTTLPDFQPQAVWHDNFDKIFVSHAPQTEESLQSLHHALNFKQNTTQAFMPLYAAGKLIGLVQFVWAESTYQLSADEEFYLNELIEPVSAVVASRRAYLAEQEVRQAIERRNLQLQTAAQISQAASGMLDPQQLMRQTIDLLRERFDLYYAGLFLIDENGDITGEPGRWAVLRAGTGEAGRIMLERNHKLEIGGNSMIGDCIASAQARVSQQAERTERRFANPLLPETRSEMALPLISRNQVIGAMSIQSIRPGDFTEADIAVLQTMADQIANALQNARLFEQTEQALSETDALYRASAELNIALNYDEILNTLAHNSILGQGELNNLSLNIFDRAWRENAPPEWSTVLARITKLPEEVLISRYPLKAFPSAFTLLNPDNPTIVEDVQHDDRLDEQARTLYAQRFAARSTIFIPLNVAGQWLGYINAVYANEMHFVESDVRRAATLVSQAAIVVQNLQSLEITRQQAREASLLFQTSQQLVQADEERTIYLAALQALHELGAPDWLSVQRLREVRGEPYLEQVIHLKTGDVEVPEDGTLFPLSLYPFTQRVLQGQTILSNNTAADTTFTEKERGLLKGLSVLGLAAIPVRLRDRVVSVLMVTFRAPHVFSQAETRFFETLIVQLGIALENYALLQETQRRARQLQTAAEVSRAANSILEPDDLIQQAVDLVRERFDLYYAGLFLVDETGEFSGEPGRWAVLRAGTGVAGMQMKAQGHKLRLGGDSMIGACIRAREARVSLNVTQDAARFQNPMLPKTRSEMALPLVARGQAIGAMTIQSEQEEAFSQEDIATLQTLADQVAIAIQNARLFNQSQSRAEELAVLNEMSQKLTSLLDADEVLEQVYTFTGRLMNVDNFFIALFDAATETISFPLAFESGQRVNWQARAKSNGLTEYVLNTQQSLLVSEELDDWVQTYGVASIGHKAQCWLGVPLLIGTQPVGVIALYSTTPNAYTEHDREVLGAIASQASIAIQNTRLFMQIQANLTETEAMYAASAQLNLALSYDDVLRTLRETTVLGQNCHTMTILYFKSVPSENRLPDTVETLNFWTLQPDAHIQPAYALSELPDAAALLSPNRPTILASLPAMGELGQRLIGLFGEDADGVLVIPLSSGGRWLGFIVAEYAVPIDFSEEQMRRVMSLAGQASVAIQNLRNIYFAEQRAQEALRRSEELALVNRVVSQVSTSLEIENTFKLVASEIGQALQTQVGIAMLNEDRQALTVMAEYPTFEDRPHAIGFVIPIENNLATQQVIETRHPLIITDAQTNPLTDSAHERLKMRGVQTLALFPIIVADEVIATLGIDYLEPGKTLSPDEIRLVESILLQASTAIQNARLFRQTQERARQERILRQVSERVRSAVDVDSIMRTAARELGSALGRNVSVYLQSTTPTKDAPHE